MRKKQPLKYSIKYNYNVTTKATHREQVVVTISFNNGHRHTQIPTIRDSSNYKSDVNKWNDEIDDGIYDYEIALIKYVADIFMQYPEDFNKSLFTDYINLYRLQLSEIYLGMVLYSLHGIVESFYEEEERMMQREGEQVLNNWPELNYIKRLDQQFDLRKVLTTYSNFRKKDLKKPFVLKDPWFYFHSLFATAKAFTDDGGYVMNHFIDDHPSFLPVLKNLLDFESSHRPFNCSLFRLISDARFKQEFQDHGKRSDLENNKDFENEVWNGAINHPQFRKNVERSSVLGNHFVKHVLKAWGVK